MLFLHWNKLNAGSAEKICCPFLHTRYLKVMDFIYGCLYLYKCKICLVCYWFGCFFNWKEFCRFRSKIFQSIIVAKLFIQWFWFDIYKFHRYTMVTFDVIQKKISSYVAMTIVIGSLKSPIHLDLFYMLVNWLIANPDRIQK